MFDLGKGHYFIEHNEPTNKDAVQKYLKDNSINKWWTIDNKKLVSLIIHNQFEIRQSLLSFSEINQ